MNRQLSVYVFVNTCPQTVGRYYTLLYINVKNKVKKDIKRIELDIGGSYFTNLP